MLPLGVVRLVFRPLWVLYFLSVAESGEGAYMQEAIACGDDRLLPACGGTEPVFTVHGVRWQYVYQPSSGRHGYYCLDTDIVEWHRSFHPSFSPEFAGQEEGSPPTPTPPQPATTTPVSFGLLVWG